MSEFTIRGKERYAKHFLLANGYIHMFVDYDDVNPQEVDAWADWVVSTLNANLDSAPGSVPMDYENDDE